MLLCYFFYRAHPTISETKRKIAILHYNYKFLRMEKMKKICLCAAAVAGTAGIAGISAKAVEGVRKKWFLRGFEAGQFIGNLTAAENFAQEKTVIQQKYDKLCEEFEELQENYNDLLRTTMKNNQL